MPNGGLRENCFSMFLTFGLKQDALGNRKRVFLLRSVFDVFAFVQVVPSMGDDVAGGFCR